LQFILEMFSHCKCLSLPNSDTRVDSICLSSALLFLHLSGKSLLIYQLTWKYMSFSVVYNTFSCSSKDFRSSNTSRETANKKLAHHML
jgi:hypothetical protein